MRDTVIVEACKKPVVVAITEEFIEHGRNIAKVSGHANLRQLVFPYPFEGLPMEEVGRVAVALYPKFLDAVGVTR
ncbi:MAG TPA: hypothetical protein VNE58_03745 [Casimicrobiaceae bacterium]|nr:hypothetical protein [Casimicrobiaceae bacterium]